MEHAKGRAKDRTCTTLPLAIALLMAVDASTNSAVAQWPVAPSWSGLYLGFHGTKSWTELDVSRRGSLDDTTTQFGGHLGYNLNLGLFLVGIEGDLNFKDSDGQMRFSSGDTLAYDIDASGSLRARFGIPIGPGLFYATAGYAWADLSADYRSSSGFKTSGTEDLSGIVYGLGAEAMILPSLSVRIEALQYDYGETKLSPRTVGRGALEIDPSATVIRAGATFHFN